MDLNIPKGKTSTFPTHGITLNHTETVVVFDPPIIVTSPSCRLPQLEALA